MKLNSDKCRLLVSVHHYEEMFVNIGNNRIWESKNVELLGITIDENLKFDKHMKYVQRQTENLMFSLGCKVSCLQKK